MLRACAGPPGITLTVEGATSREKSLCSVVLLLLLLPHPQIATNETSKLHEKSRRMIWSPPGKRINQGKSQGRKPFIAGRLFRGGDRSRGVPLGLEKPD